jgi:hypothetical protein
MQSQPSTAMTALPEQQAGLGQFRALVMREGPLQETLAGIEDAERFVALALEAATARGIALPADALRAAAPPDPLGLARWRAAPADGTAWPPPSWLPIHVAAADGGVFVDWAHLGAAPLNEPFFEQTIRRALARPFNRVFRYCMTMDDFVAPAARGQSVMPSGFIFHMSRCGSTLVSQMLAALPSNLVISEAAPIDAAVQLDRIAPDLPAERRLDALAAMIAAFGRFRRAETRHYVIKLDCWHTLALPLLRRAFPSVPWVFLYRDPVEVLVSQRRQPGMQMVPNLVPASLYGIDSFDGVEDYYARVLASICRAALDHRRDGGLLVNYRSLPQAVFTAIMPHFGMACDKHERDVMAAAARRDAKAPHFEFADDNAAKQSAASAPLRALAERHLGDIYRRLEGR